MAPGLNFQAPNEWSEYDIPTYLRRKTVPGVSGTGEETGDRNEVTEKPVKTQYDVVSAINEAREVFEIPEFERTASMPQIKEILLQAFKKRLNGDFSSENIKRFPVNVLRLIVDFLPKNRNTKFRDMPLEAIAAYLSEKLSEGQKAVGAEVSTVSNQIENVDPAL